MHIRERYKRETARKSVKLGNGFFSPMYVQYLEKYVKSLQSQNREKDRLIQELEKSMDMKSERILELFEALHKVEFIVSQHFVNPYDKIQAIIQSALQNQTKGE